MSLKIDLLKTTFYFFQNKGEDLNSSISSRRKPVKTEAVKKDEIDLGSSLHGQLESNLENADVKNLNRSLNLSVSFIFISKVNNNLS